MEQPAAGPFGPAARAHEFEQSLAGTRQRRLRSQRAADFVRVHVLVQAVAAEHKHLAVMQFDAFDIGRDDGAVADHACRIVGRTAGRRLLAQLAIRVIARQKLGGFGDRRARAIDAAVADPCNQPVGERRTDARAQRDRRCAGTRARPRDPAAQFVVRIEKRCADCSSIDCSGIDCSGCEGCGNCDCN